MDHQALSNIIPLSLLSLFIVATNAAVCALVYMYKSLRSYTNGFVCSLAISDILTGGLIFPLYMAKPASPVMNHVICVVLLAGVANVVAVTFDRYVAVMKSLKYSSIMPKYFLPVVIISWVLPTIVTFIPLFWNKDETVLAHKIFILSLQIFGIVIPYSFVFMAYYQIFKQVKKCVRKLKRELSITQNTAGRRKILRSQSEAKIALTFTLVALLFICSWLPVVYITIVHALGRPGLAPPPFQTASLFTLAAGSLANPFLYSFMKPDFKMTLKVLIWRKTNMFSQRHPKDLSPSRCASVEGSSHAGRFPSSCRRMSSPQMRPEGQALSTVGCSRKSELRLLSKPENCEDEQQC